MARSCQPSRDLHWRGEVVAAPWGNPPRWACAPAKVGASFAVTVPWTAPRRRPRDAAIRVSFLASCTSACVPGAPTGIPRGRAPGPPCPHVVAVHARRPASRAPVGEPRLLAPPSARARDVPVPLRAAAPRVPSQPAASGGAARGRARSHAAGVVLPPGARWASRPPHRPRAPAAAGVVGVTVAAALGRRTPHCLPAGGGGRGHGAAPGWSQGEPMGKRCSSVYPPWPP